MTIDASDASMLHIHLLHRRPRTNKVKRTPHVVLGRAGQRVGDVGQGVR